VTDPLNAARRTYTEAVELLVAGRFEEALAAFGAAREVFNAHGQPVEAALCAAETGNAQFKLGRFSEARAAYGSAQEVFDAHGRPAYAAFCVLGVGNAEFGLGRFSEAGAAYGTAREVFDAHGQPLDAASCLLGVGQVELRLGRLSEARAAYGTAREVFDAHGQPAEAARCVLGVGDVELRLGRLSEARAAYGTAREVFDAHGQPAEAARCVLGVGDVELRLGRLSEAGAAYGTAREVFDAHGQPLYAASCLLGVGQVEVGFGRFEDARIAFGTAREVFDAHGQPVSAALCVLGVGSVERRLGRFSEARIAYGTAREVFDAHGQPVEAALCVVGLGRVEVGLGRFEEGLGLVLEGLMTVESLRYRLVRSAERVAWSRAWADIYELALELAARLGDASLVTELIEIARIQAVPAAGRSGAGGVVALGLDVVLADVAASKQAGPWASRGMVLRPAAHEALVSRGDALLGRARAAVDARFELAPPPRVTVGRRWRLGELLGQSALEGVEALSADSEVVLAGSVDLDELRARFGASKAWWLGLWRVGGWLYWSLIGPGGVVEAGRVEWRQDLIDRLAQAVMRPTEEEIAASRQVDPALQEELLRRVMGARVATGPLLGDPQAARACFPGALRRRFPMLARLCPPPVVDPHAAEGLMAGELGAWLLPERLQSVLAGHMDSDDGPLRLLVGASPELVGVPWALLGVPAAGLAREGDPRRLLEAAVVSVVPSAALLDALEASGPPDDILAAPRVIVSVCDPLGDLANSRQVPAGTTSLLACPGSVTGPPRPRPASVANLAQALAGVVPGGPGVFVYHGHHDPPDPTSPADTGGFRLFDPATSQVESFPARMFLEHPGPGRPNCPRLAMPFGCDTLAGHDSPEWTSMTPALLWAGARHVAATLWPILDNPATATFEASLIATFADSDDPPVALRELQLAALIDYRTRPGTSSSAPYIWAAYTLTSAPEVVRTRAMQTARQRSTMDETRSGET